ncbi:methyl-accepting chemotaxis sensory transducer with Pas/Pac sensor [Palleronia marisminoris]|uniref:Biofilm dispersion protein BdlA n=1 Tax=Palleronia marisminoris TaxID=315423 RepID=A0A1Y5SL53_9RHOB|nr:PAS domain-containing methyl-accepting chemotaxis protein [Palleronia marisminoris]SFG81636.1 methyl-accepting chemotaxis sensory transducer with Pas/Pac sensor [Palleronia marisminoris]SLN40210.1 Biofilm dispersion protein BdlA [Palleronia marisminoris]
MLNNFFRKPRETGLAEAMLAGIKKSHMVIRLDLSGKILEANEVAAESAGVKLADVLGQNYAQFMRPKDVAAKEFQRIAETVRAGGSVQKIAPALNNAGEEVWYDLTYSPLDTRDGTREILVVAHDITEMHLRRRDNRSQVDAIRRSMGVIEFDLQGNILDANDHFLEAVGYSIDEVRGHHHRIFVRPKEAATSEYKEFWNKLSQGSSSTGRVERIGKNGEPIWLRATYETLSDPEGRPFKVVKYAFDITADANMQADATHQIEAIQKVQAVIEFAPDGTIIRANDIFCNVLGYRENEIAGKHHRIFVQENHANSTEYRDFWAKLRDGHEQDGNFVRVGKNGNNVYIRASYSPIRDASGRVAKVVKFAIDTTSFEIATRTLSNGLGQLASGDLSARIANDLGEFDSIRTSFNEAVERLNSVVQSTNEVSLQLNREADAVAEATDNLARRTERQAATLEESAASLEDLTSVVHAANKRASEARVLAESARTDTDRSNEVVQNAMSAMADIAEFSRKISSITSLIDDISFQTNLLALNAGVEAARAGDAGRGFAVVASEVRALAQRSSDAAKEIATLISSSTEQVDRGVNLVNQAGDSLSTIRGKVQEIHAGVETISGMTEEQSQGISGLNVAIGDLDRVTQQNAAMAEETNAAIQALGQGISQLRGEFEFFRTEGPDVRKPRLRSVS